MSQMGPYGTIFFHDILFLLNQISMSVLQNPVRVMKTLIAPTVTVLTAVHVSKDSLEMERRAKVFFSLFSMMNHSRLIASFVKGIPVL